MSFGFVSGGTADAPVERDDEWLKAQQEIEATRRRKEEESRQEGGKTLYEVLQNNKAAKQEAFEESIRLKNQFRNLDEDEIEFLDSVLESTRAKEEAVKKETTEQLDVFRRQQEEADKALLSETGDHNDIDAPGKASSPPVTESQWAINARKRKRVKAKEGLKGVKLRKSSTTREEPPALGKQMREDSPATLAVMKNSVNHIAATKGVGFIEKPSLSSPSPTSPSIDASKSTISGGLGLGLAGYSSDEDE